jgi:hypothetical protein
MKDYESGSPAPWGIYLSIRALDVRAVDADGELLEGKRGARYLHVPAPLTLFAALAIGGVYAVLFPLVIFLAVATGLSMRLRPRRRAGAAKEQTG